MREDLVVYVSEQGHSSLARAARVLGFGPSRSGCFPLTTSSGCVRALEAAIDRRHRGGRRPLAVMAVAGTTNTGAVDPSPSWPRLPGTRHLAARRRRVRRVRRADRTWRRRWQGWTRRLRHARPAQVALPTVRVRRPAGATGPPAPGGLRDPPVVPPGHRGPRRRGELRRPRAAADQDEPCTQGLDVAAVLRRGRLRRRDRPGDGPGRARAASDRGGTRARAVGAGHPGDRRVPSAPARARTTRRTSSGPTPRSSPALRRAARDSSPRPGCPADTPSACACSTTARRRPTSTGCSTGCRRRRSPEVAPAESPVTGPAAQETKTADVGAGWPGAVAADVDQLRAHPLLADVDEDRLHWVASVGRRRFVAAGEHGRPPVGGRPGLLPAPRGRRGRVQPGTPPDHHAGRRLLRRARSHGLGSDLRLPPAGHGQRTH